MLIPMGVAGRGQRGRPASFPGLLLVPIASIERELGFEPIAADARRAAAGPRRLEPARHVALTLLLAALLTPWLWLGRRAGIVRSDLHLCGVDDIAPEAMRPSTARLYETPDAVLRRALFAPERAVEDEQA